MRSVNYIIFPKEVELISLFYRDTVILPTLEYISGSSIPFKEVQKNVIWMSKNVKPNLWVNTYLKADQRKIYLPSETCKE